MTEHPIIFNSEMVKAVLNGHKTQTRRIAKLPEKWHRGFGAFENNPNGAEEFVIHGDCGTETTYCPYGKVGDTLWVRETTKLGTTWPPIASVEYIADGTKLSKQLTEKDWKKFGKRKYPHRHLDNIPSIHMFKSCARIFLEITNIRVERVQDISESDAEAEGTNCDRTYREDFKHLWDSINAKRYEAIYDGEGNKTKRLLNYGWDKNPWCWCISFKQALK